MAKLSLKIITPERIVYENEVDEVYVPTEAGMVGILANHIPMVSALKTGEIRVKKDGDILPLSVSGGLVEIRPNSKVVILADYSEFAHEIDLVKAEEAYARAKKVMEEKENIQDVEFAKFQSMFERELNRVRIGTKYHKRG